MYFTQNDYRNIQKWLLLHSIKDSEFTETDNTNDEDFITIVQEGINKKIPISKFVADTADFVNITRVYGVEKISLSEAVALIPEDSRRRGLEITFISPDGSWMIYQYTGEDVEEENWNKEENWKNPVIDPEHTTPILIDNDTLTSINGIVEVRDGSLGMNKLSKSFTDEILLYYQLLGDMYNALGDLIVKVDEQDNIIKEQDKAIKALQDITAVFNADIDGLYVNQNVIWSEIGDINSDISKLNEAVFPQSQGEPISE